MPWFESTSPAERERLRQGLLGEFSRENPQMEDFLRRLGYEDPKSARRRALELLEASDWTWVGESGDHFHTGA